MPELPYPIDLSPTEIAAVAAVVVLTSLLGAAVGAALQRRRMIRRLADIDTDDPHGVADGWSTRGRRLDGALSLLILAVGGALGIAGSLAGGLVLMRTQPLLASPAPAAPQVVIVPMQTECPPEALAELLP